MNENEKKDELLNEEQINDNVQAEVTENAAQTEESPKYYIPPHDEGWRPYDTSKEFANNWDYKNKKKKDWETRTHKKVKATKKASLISMET